MKLSENKKMQVVFCVGSVALILIIYAVMSQWIKWDVEKEKVVEARVEENSNTNILMDIRVEKEVEDGLLVSGWAMKYRAEIVDVKVVLQAISDTEMHVLKTELGDNKELVRQSEYWRDDEAEGGGFTAQITEAMLQEGVCYDIQLYLGYVQKLSSAVEGEEITKERVRVRTNKYLYEGEVYDYSPHEFIEPVFTDEQMKRVVAEGKVCGCDIEYGVWLYQYEKNLYWILDKEQNELYGKDKKIFVHLSSLNNKKLPESRRMYGFDNKDFLFSAQEIALGEKELYEAAKMSLESEYPITRVRTGIIHAAQERGWEFNVPILVLENTK